MPESNKTIWIRCTADDIKVGMQIRAVEKHESGTIVGYEGEVHNITGRLIYFNGGLPTWRESEPGIEVELYRQPRQLPMREGSAVKVYDPQYLCDRVAVRRYRGALGERQELAWYWADQRTIETVSDHLLESATVLFDAGQA